MLACNERADKRSLDIKLIIIDTLGRFTKKISKIKGYQADVDELAPLQELAMKNGICILLIHHTRKTSADSINEEILGSMGVLATPDSLLVLKI